MVVWLPPAVSEQWGVWHTARLPEPTLPASGPRSPVRPPRRRL